MIERERRGDVEIIVLAHGKVSALDLEFANALADELGSLEKSGSPVVITGRGSVFSAGVDLFRIVSSDSRHAEQFLDALDRVLEALFFHRAPVVAAVNGHAIAGGCIIAEACDYRIMGEGRGTIGVPELQVGVPFPPLALEIIRFAVRPDVMKKLVYLGETLSPAEALAHGMVDEVVPADSLIDRAVEVASKMGRIPRESFLLTKESLRASVRDRARTLHQAMSQRIREVWGSAESREVIAAYLEKTVGRRS